MSTLPKKAKVVIIGGGIHGLSTAWKLSETYKNPGDIVILEKKRYCSRCEWNSLWCYKK
jgi:glycine/D-amino acid oxidase-like deaminating enzyme